MAKNTAFLNNCTINFHLKYIVYLETKLPDFVLLAMMEFSPYLLLKACLRPQPTETWEEFYSTVHVRQLSRNARLYDIIS